MPTFSTKPTTSVRIDNDPHAYVKAFAMAYGISQTRALADIIGSYARIERIQFCITECESDDGEVFYEASLGTSETGDFPLCTFYQGPSKLETEKAVRERMVTLGFSKPYRNMRSVQYKTERIVSPADDLVTVRDATQAEAA